MSILQVSFGSENRPRNPRVNSGNQTTSASPTRNYRSSQTNRQTNVNSNRHYQTQNPSEHRNKVRENSGMNRQYSDTYVPQHKKTSSDCKCPKALKGPLAIFTAFVLALSLRSCSVDKVLDIQAQKGETLDYFAQVYDSDVDVLMDYNNLKSNEIPCNMEISIPPKFNILDGKVEELQDKLYDNGLSVETRNELEDKIENIQEIEKLQSQYAKVYTDGKFVYYLITGSINVETFKDLFGIKDAVIRKYNDLDFSWGSDAYGGYKDYTGNQLVEGETIKVPVGAVKESLIERLQEQ